MRRSNRGWQFCKSSVILAAWWLILSWKLKRRTRLASSRMSRLSKSSNRTMHRRWYQSWKRCSRQGSLIHLLGVATSSQLSSCPYPSVRGIPLFRVSRFRLPAMSIWTVLMPSQVWSHRPRQSMRMRPSLSIPQALWTMAAPHSF